mmetsp:Transcript_9246/g.23112  ORF Transcript_9246/g.23112 Transcript_9246/m.23112 type:complete len:385 (+) Transcript_9246:265-1419(+)
MISSFTSPKVPIRNTFPLSFISPPPSDRLYLWYAANTNLAPSIPSGSRIVVTVPEYSLAFFATGVSPHAFTASRTPCAIRLCLAHTFSIPSSSSISIASLSPHSSCELGVYGKYPSGLFASMSAHEKNTRGSVAVFDAAIAFCDTHTNPSPAGIMNPFWEPVTATSTPQSSNRNSRLAIEDTPSTMNSAGCFALSIAARTPGMSENTPVVVSFCTTHTALYSLFVSALSAASILSAGAPSPQSISIITGITPNLCIRSIHRCENCPYRHVSTLSPGLSALAIADSQPPVPVAMKTKGTPAVVRKIFLRSARTEMVRAGKSAERWSWFWRCMARRTRSGTREGPGTMRKFSPLGVAMVGTERVEAEGGRRSAWGKLDDVERGGVG